MAQSAAQVVIVIVVVVIIETDPLLLVLLHRTFIVSTLLEFPPYFYLVALPTPARALFWEA